MHATRAACYAVTPLPNTEFNGIDFRMQLPTAQCVTSSPKLTASNNPEPWKHLV